MLHKINPYKLSLRPLVRVGTVVFLFFVFPIFGTAQSDFEKMKRAEEAYRKKQQSKEKDYASNYEATLDSMHLEFINYEIEREKEVIEFEGKNLDPRLIKKAEALEARIPRINTYLKQNDSLTVLESLSERKKDLEKVILDTPSIKPKGPKTKEATIEKEKEIEVKKDDEIEGKITENQKQDLDSVVKPKKKPVTDTILPETTRSEKEIIELELEANRPIYIPILKEDYRISSHFNPNRMHPVLKKRRPHKGIDLAAKKQTPIYATANGIVEIARFSKSAGNWVMINHQNGYKTKYFHMSSLSVKPNQKVNAGDLVGYVGTTGYSSGPHLHYEIRQKNTPIDPHNFMVIHFDKSEDKKQ